LNSSSPEKAITYTSFSPAYSKFSFFANEFPRSTFEPCFLLKMRISRLISLGQIWLNAFLSVVVESLKNKMRRQNSTSISREGWHSSALSIS
jgi:hypothetical protein